jgi:FMN phosphatase YigB (HAD superfamily)
VDRSTPGAVILDVDGTMYRQGLVRLRMMLRLAVYAARRPREGTACLVALRAYRRAQERLRAHPLAIEHQGVDQVGLASRMTGLDESTMRGHVERWMERAPLDLVARAARPGLKEFLVAARQRGTRIGVYSDYRAEAKLLALGVRRLIDVVRSAQDDGGGRLKPDPAGLLLVASELGVAPQSTVYVGDRVDVDAVAARRAGMRAYMLESRAPRGSEDWISIDGFSEVTGMWYSDH